MVGGGGALPGRVLLCTTTISCSSPRDKFTFRLSSTRSVPPGTEKTTKFRLFAWYGWLDGSPCPSCTVLCAIKCWLCLNGTGVTAIENQSYKARLISMYSQRTLDDSVVPQAIKTMPKSWSVNEF